MNAAENNALQGLTTDSQIIYLRLIRFHMDYASGISGQERRITELCMRQVIEYVPPWGSNQKAQQAPTRDYIRARVEELERAGLIERFKHPGRMVFRCVLATWDQCDQKRNARGTPEEHPAARPSEHTKKQHQATENKRKDKNEYTEERPEENQRKVEGTPGNPLSVIRDISKEDKSSLVPLDTGLQEVCRETWKAYSDAFFDRYKTEPVRNARVSSQIKQFVQRVGYSEARHVARHYVSHNSAFYVRQLHSVGPMLADAEKLVTEYRTGTRMTATAAQQQDKSGSMHDAVAQIERERQTMRGQTYDAA